MDLSVVVPTLNARDRLPASLDALEECAPDAEVVVVNGPSSDGTSGMVRGHSAPDVLLELSERNLNTARNAGIAAATGDVIGFVSHDSQISEDWVDVVASAIDDGADVVTGPVHRRVDGGHTTESLETSSIGSRTVRYFDGGNVAFTRATIEALDGFDQYLHTGAARDAAHRLAGLDARIAWAADMVVLREETDDVFHRIGDDDEATVLGLKYRSLAYRLAKNYGFGPSFVRSIVRDPLEEAVTQAWDVIRGDASPSQWFVTGSNVLRNIAQGTQDGLSARVHDRSPTRNPNGVSTQTQRPVARYSL